MPHSLQVQAITVTPGAPAVLAWQPTSYANSAYKWVPAQVLTAYRFAGGTGPTSGSIGGTFTLADLRARVPEAFEDYNPAPTAWDGKGRAYRWTHFAPRDPEAGDPQIRTWGDLYRNFTDRQIRLLMKVQDVPHNMRGDGPTARALQADLAAGTWNETRAGALRWLAYQINHGKARNYRHAIGGPGLDTFTTPPSFERELGSLNRELVSKWAAGLIEPGEMQIERADALRQIAVGLGAKPEAPADQNLAAFVAAFVSETFTARGVAFDEAVEAYQAQGAAFDFDRLAGSAIELTTAQAATVAGTQGIGDSFKKLVRHPLKWARSVVREAGKGVSQGAALILDNAAKVGWLNDYIVKPTFIGAQLEIIRQLGNAMIEGSIGAFKEQAVATNFAEGAQIAGAAALAVSQFLPPPWSIAVAATGAALVAASRGILAAQARTKAINEREEDLKQIEAAKAARQAEQAAAEKELLELESERVQAATLAEEAARRAEQSAQARKYGIAAGMAVAAIGALYALTR